MLRKAARQGGLGADCDSDDLLAELHLHFPGHPKGKGEGPKITSLESLLFFEQIKPVMCVDMMKTVVLSWIVSEL